MIRRNQENLSQPTPPLAVELLKSRRCEANNQVDFTPATVESAEMLAEITDFFDQAYYRSGITDDPRRLWSETEPALFIPKSDQSKVVVNDAQRIFNNGFETASRLRSPEIMDQRAWDARLYAGKELLEMMMQKNEILVQANALHIGDWFVLIVGDHRTFATEQRCQVAKTGLERSKGRRKKQIKIITTTSRIKIADTTWVIKPLSLSEQK